MASIKVTKASTVKSIKRQFESEFNCSIRMYNGARFADDKMKISELSKTDNPGGSLELGARSRVENVEGYFKETFGNMLKKKRQTKVSEATDVIMTMMYNNS